MEESSKTAIVVTKHGFVKVKSIEGPPEACTTIKYDDGERGYRTVHYCDEGSTYLGHPVYIERDLKARESAPWQRSVVALRNCLTPKANKISHHADDKELVQLRADKEDILRELKRMGDEMDVLRYQNENGQRLLMAKEARNQELMDQVVELEADKFALTRVAGGAYGMLPHADIPDVDPIVARVTPIPTTDSTVYGITKIEKVQKHNQEIGPSAVSKVKEHDFHRGPRVYCQGDYLD